MNRFFKPFYKSIRSGLLLEAGAALLFFGALAQQNDLPVMAIDALKELKASGYQIPSEDDPVRIFPALTGGDFSGDHAGGWRPGSIYLRQNPQGGVSEAVYLRHELFHEASHRTCGGRLPAWAEEAGALQFSGELTATAISTDEPPTETELEALKSAIRIDKPMDKHNRSTLARLVHHVGWPLEPCAVSTELKELLGTPFDEAGVSGYVLMSVLSGRILESGGDIDSRLPPGSLLKIPYAASLSQANPEVLAEELAASDTGKLLQRRAYFVPNRYRLLLSSIPSLSLAAPLPQPFDPMAWRSYLGERDTTGEYPLQARLPELALTMRASLLAEPSYFKGLTRNGSVPGSTLYGQRPGDKTLLRSMQALSKTGTVSTADGQPLAGHLLVAWPASHPVYLAVFRQRGVKGAGILPKAAERLKSWQQTYPTRFAAVRVRLLTPTDPASWEAQAECPEISGHSNRFTLCGQFRIVSSARSSRSERLVSGILHRADHGGPVVLETDVESYTDAVLAAEAETLTGSARQAMRAVIAWNGSHGNHRHADSASLCDTTHCMVFMGRFPNDNPRRAGPVDSNLLNLLDKLAADHRLNWLPFSKGGDQRWRLEISHAELTARFSESQIQEIRRERRKNGDVFVHLFYPDNEETVSCEIFRNTLKLPSCPELIDANLDRTVWKFQGIGEGHGEGLEIVHAQALADAGRTAEQILQDAYARKPCRDGCSEIPERYDDLDATRTTR